MSDRIDLDIRPSAGPETAPVLTMIVPLARLEAVPDRLLQSAPSGAEVILARGGTRAASMNRAALAARGAHLWFVHADTKVSTEAAAKLASQLASGPAALRYFDLAFDGGFAMRVTEFGVRVRSRVFGMPFGDQAFCLPATAFATLGGYDETAPYGEDHLLVWSARRQRLPVLPVGATVLTSARKYREHGWFRTTGKHLWLTAKQAWPEFLAGTKSDSMPHRERADRQDTPLR